MVDPNSNNLSAKTIINRFWNDYIKPKKSLVNRDGLVYMNKKKIHPDGESFKRECIMKNTAPF